MKIWAILVISCVFLLNEGAHGRFRFFRQSDWENFEPWRQVRQNPRPRPTRPQQQSQTTTALPAGATPPVVDGNGSLLGCNCPAPPQFNPVCGSDGVTYGNLQKLNCARTCGRNVRLSFTGSCSNG